MKKYQVVIPWQGVSVGDVVETDNLHPALLPNVIAIEGKSAEPEAKESKEPKKHHKAKED